MRVWPSSTEIWACVYLRVCFKGLALILLSCVYMFCLFEWTLERFAFHSAELSTCVRLVVYGGDWKIWFCELIEARTRRRIRKIRRKNIIPLSSFSDCHA